MTILKLLTEIYKELKIIRKHLEVITKHHFVADNRFDFMK